MRKRGDEVWITHDGRTMRIEDWCKETGLLDSTIRKRLDTGWSPSAAVTTPSNRKDHTLARYRKIAELNLQGLSNAEISRRLGVSYLTVCNVLDMPAKALK